MCYLTHDLEGPDVDIFLHKNKVLHSDLGVLGHRLGETGTMEQLYHSNTFFCYPAIMYFKPESPVSSAPCITCARHGASKKKVLVHGLMQRAPRLVGCSRENVFYRRER